MMDNKTSSSVLIALRRIMRAVDLHSKKMEKQYGLTGPQLILLKEISRLGETPIGRLAKEINLSNATVTGIVDRLEKKSLVERLRNSRDRRLVLIEVTKEGNDILQSAPSPLQERFIGKFERLPKSEQNEILSSLERLAAIMDAESLEVAPLLTGGPLPESRRNNN